MSEVAASAVASSEYEAIGIYTELPRGKASGTLTVTAKRLHFACEEAEAVLPVDGLSLKFGGARNRLIFFSHADHSEWSIYTTDHSVLSHPVLRSHPDLARETGRLQREKRTALTYGAALVALCAGVLMGLFLLKEPLVVFIANQVPADIERQLGEASFEQVTASSRFIEEPALKATVAALAEPLIAVASDGQAHQFQLHIVEDDAINAFAMPGGFIVVHTALLLKADTPEEITGVLAHEIAHVTRRHSLRQIISTLGLYTLVSTFLGDIGGISSVLIDSGTMLATLQFSRDFEREADDVGWGYLYEASIDPRGMISFFEKIKSQESNTTPEGTMQESLSFLSTHPATDERIAYLQEKLERHDGNVRPLLHRDDFMAFQDDLRAYLNAE